MTLSKCHVTLLIILVFLKDPMYYQIHARFRSQGSTVPGFMMGEGAASPPLPDYLTSKKPRLVRVKSFNAWLGQRHATKMSRRRPSVLDGEILSLHCTLKYSHNKSSV